METVNISAINYLGVTLKITHQFPVGNIILFDCIIERDNPIRMTGIMNDKNVKVVREDLFQDLIPIDDNNYLLLERDALTHIKIDSSGIMSEEVLLDNHETLTITKSDKTKVEVSGLNSSTKKTETYNFAFSDNKFIKENIEQKESIQPPAQNTESQSTKEYLTPQTRIQAEVSASFPTPEGILLNKKDNEEYSKESLNESYLKESLDVNGNRKLYYVEKNGKNPQLFASGDYEVQRTKLNDSTFLIRDGNKLYFYYRNPDNKFGRVRLAENKWNIELSETEANVFYIEEFGLEGKKTGYKYENGKLMPLILEQDITQIENKEPKELEKVQPSNIISLPESDGNGIKVSEDKITYTIQNGAEKREFLVFNGKSKKRKFFPDGKIFIIQGTTVIKNQSIDQLYRVQITSSGEVVETKLMEKKEISNLTPNDIVYQEKTTLGYLSEKLKDTAINLYNRIKSSLDDRFMRINEAKPFIDQHEPELLKIDEEEHQEAYLKNQVLYKNLAEYLCIKYGKTLFTGNIESTQTIIYTDFDVIDDTYIELYCIINGKKLSSYYNIYAEEYLSQEEYVNSKVSTKVG